VAIQAAKSIGAYVATTARVDDRAYVQELGADEVIDYQQEAFEDKLKNFDAVLDTIGGDRTEKSFKVLREGGTLVSMVGPPPPEMAQKARIMAIGQSTHVTTDVLKRLAQPVEGGAVRIRVAKVTALEEAKEAFQLVEEGHPHGKVVFEVKQG
jgi:NADPH:quinone reductase-like Zn-dependent oxidoreductase